MLMAIPRSDQCDATLRVGNVERHRKQFCCLTCLRAFMNGELKRIRPHDHSVHTSRFASVGLRDDSTR